jgi:hypothetical protein
MSSGYLMVFVSAESVQASGKPIDQYAHDVSCSTCNFRYRVARHEDGSPSASWVNWSPLDGNKRRSLPTPPYGYCGS